MRHRLQVTLWQVDARLDVVQRAARSGVLGQRRTILCRPVLPRRDIGGDGRWRGRAGHQRWRRHQLWRHHQLQLLRRDLSAAGAAAAFTAAAAAAAATGDAAALACNVDLRMQQDHQEQRRSNERREEPHRTPPPARLAHSRRQHATSRLASRTWPASFGVEAAENPACHHAGYIG